MTISMQNMKILNLLKSGLKEFYWIYIEYAKNQAAVSLFVSLYRPQTNNSKKVIQKV